MKSNNFKNSQNFLDNFIENFIKFLMIDGKKNKAYNIFYECINFINKELYKMNFLDISVSSKGYTGNTENLKGIEGVETISTRRKNIKKLNSNITSKLKASFFSINNIEKRNTNKINIAFIKKINFFAKALHVVFRAVDNVKPNLEIRKVRVSGLTYQVPSLLSKKKQTALAIKWIITSAKERKHQSKDSFSKCLSQEIIDAFNKQGQARQKRDELHRLAEANRAYIRYRWW